MNGKQRSAAVYHSQVKGGMSDGQNALVLHYMEKINQPQSIRMLHSIMNKRGYKIDLIDLRRCITNLSKQNPKGRWLNKYGRAMVKEAFNAKCPITELTVGWYQIIPAAPQQMPLFNPSEKQAA
jgi:hypothetical protein